MFTFETKEDFEAAVKKYLTDNINIYVSMEQSEDYYNRDRVPVVEVCLEGDRIARGKAW